MIVITGGSGFIGSNLVKFLNKNNKEEKLFIKNKSLISDEIVEKVNGLLK